MYGPDSYLYETNLALLSTLSDEELADTALVAKLAAEALPFAGLSATIAAAATSVVTALGAWFAPTNEADAQAAYWMFPPLY